MKKLSIYLALVASWASAYPAATLRKFGSVMRQATRTLTAQAIVAAQSRAHLFTTRALSQKANKKEEPFIIKISQSVQTENTQSSGNYEFNDLAKRGKEIRDLHEQNRKIDRENRSKFIQPYLEKHLPNLNAQQICMLTELLPEKMQEEWSIKVLESHFESCVKDTNDIIILLDALSYYRKQEYALKIITHHFDTIEVYHLATLLDNLTIDQRKEFFFSKIEQGISLEKFSVMALYFLPYLSQEEHKKTLTAFYEQFIDHKAESSRGPLFCPNYFIRHFEHLPLTYGHTPIQELLPEIAAYTALQYQKGNLVFYHARNTFWQFLTDIYKELYALKHSQSLPKEYVPLRFTKDSLVGDTEHQLLMSNGDSSGVYREHLLFLNMIPIANQDPGSNSWRYFIKNFDYTIHKQRNPFPQIEKLFSDFDMEEIYETLIKDIKNLFEIYEQAIQEKGNYGQMLVFSVDPKTAQKNIYSGGAGGVLNPLLINKQKTTDPVTIAKHFDQVPRSNQFVLVLTPDIVDPKTGVIVKAFDPVMYKQTPKAAAYKAELVKVMEKVKKLHLRQS